MGTAGPNLVAEEVITDELPAMDDSAMVSVQPEGPTPAAPAGTTPADPEPRWSGWAVRTPEWHQDYHIGYEGLCWSDFAL